MNAVTSGNLIISSNLNISEIQEFDMKIEKNCHTAARIIGSIPDETGESHTLIQAEDKLRFLSGELTDAKEHVSEIAKIHHSIHIWSRILI